MERIEDRILHINGADESRIGSNHRGESNLCLSGGALLLQAGVVGVTGTDAGEVET